MTNRQYKEICLSKFESAKELFEEKVYPNIETYRKGSCKVRFTDKNGKPICNTKVTVNQKTHDFKFGAHIFMLDEFETEEKNKEYRKMFKEFFNLATVPIYWNGLEPERGKPRFDKDSQKIYRRPAADLCLNYCDESGIDAKMHCLVYDKFIPDWLPKDDMKAMEELYEKRIKEIGEKYSERLYEIEVINELLSEHAWHGHSVISTKRDILEWSFALARKYFKDNTLVVNDGNYVPEIADKDYRHPYFMLIDAALSKGVEIDKIGIQNHIYCGVVRPQEEEIHDCCDFFDPQKIIKGFEYLSEFGKPLEITEITIPTVGEGEEAEEIQAELLKYLYTIWFSVPQMETIVYWNTVDSYAYEGARWHENNCRGGLWHRDLTPKKSALMLKKLLYEVWHTDLEIKTDENGCAEFRGFYGDYEAELNGETVKFGIHKAEENSYHLEF